MRFAAAHSERGMCPMKLRQIKPPRANADDVSGNSR
jgi:hypothetical protein